METQLKLVCIERLAYTLICMLLRHRALNPVLMPGNDTVLNNVIYFSVYRATSFLYFWYILHYLNIIFNSSYQAYHWISPENKVTISIVYAEWIVQSMEMKKYLHNWCTMPEAWRRKKNDIEHPNSSLRPYQHSIPVIWKVSKYTFHVVW